MHCFEGPDWHFLKRGRERFARGPLVKADPLGRCGGALVYGLQMIILKSSQVLFSFKASFDLLSFCTAEKFMDFDWAIFYRVSSHLFLVKYSSPLKLPIS